MPTGLGLVLMMWWCMKHAQPAIHDGRQARYVSKEAVGLEESWCDGTPEKYS